MCCIICAGGLFASVCLACLLQFVSRLNHLGGCLDMHACFLLQRGLKTLPLRVRQQSANALALAQFLEKQPQVGCINLLPEPFSCGELFWQCKPACYAIVKQHSLSVAAVTAVQSSKHVALSCRTTRLSH